MAIILVATPGAANANTYLTAEEDDAYQATRLHNSGFIASGDEQARSLVMATRMIDAYFSTASDEVAVAEGKRVVYAWTGAAASSEQALCWPRTSMTNRNGYVIPSGVIPQELKNATAELAAQLRVADRTLDNDVAAQGIKSLSAGPVSLSFKDSIEAKPMPDAVFYLLVPSWYKRVVASQIDFEVM